LIKCLIIIPAYNEAENIEPVVDNIIKNYPQYDYVIINDGSKDNTIKICDKKKYNYINLPINLGIGGAVQTGYKYARKHGYDAAVQMDGDGQHDVKSVGSMLQLIEDDEADIVIGSRFCNNEGYQSSLVRRAGIKFLSNLIFLCTLKRIKDVTSGYRMVNRKFINIYAESYPTDYPEPEAIVEGVMNKGRVKEIPVVMKERTGGESSINFMRSIYYMIKVTLAIIICRISLGVRR